MIRRSFLRFIGWAPVIAGTSITALATPQGHVQTQGKRVTRLSTSDKRDVGYNDWDKMMGSGLNAKIYLDGVEQECVLTADEVLGYVYKCIPSPKGGNSFVICDDNIKTNYIATTLEYGKVEIVIEENKS